MHRIRRQILELGLFREAGAYALQQRAGRVFQEKVLPELDRIFTRLAPEGRVIQLDRLEIDLGALGENNWELQFKEACIQQIEKQLGKLIADAPFSSDPGIRIKEQEGLNWEIFSHYLQCGVLPWHAKSLSLRDLETDLKPVMLREGPLLLQNLLTLLRQSSPAVQRLTTQFSRNFTVSFVEAILRLPFGWVARVLDLGKSLFAQPLDSRLYQKFIESLILDEARGSLPEVPDSTWVAQYFYGFGGDVFEDSGQLGLRRADAVAPDEKDGSGKLAGDTELPSQANRQKKNTDYNGEPDYEISRGTDDAAPEENQSAGKLSRETKLSPQANRQKKNTDKDHEFDYEVSPHGSPQDAQPPEKKQSAPEALALLFPKNGKPAEPAFGLPVANAGLVLFAPYLALFFRQLNYQIPEPDQHRAVHLLHYLATGAENPEEPVLLLPKLLCGMPPELPPDALLLEESPLTEQEKTEARRLCEAIIKNWPILKNTSVEGLQNSFIRREGLLYNKDNKTILLRMERLGQDVLLDTLPWTISVIKLPWMDFQLQVEW